MSKSSTSIQPAVTPIKPPTHHESPSQKPNTPACPPPPVRKRLRDEFRTALIVQGKAKKTIDSYVDSVVKFHEFHHGLNPLK
ncbi:MAG: hypothetical protein JW902_10215, partial [Syntrophaceae bacterium]|nr:hypothetical protein [Syntrophaceae bacterium]